MSQTLHPAPVEFQGHLQVVATEAAHGRPARPAPARPDPARPVSPIDEGDTYPTGRLHIEPWVDPVIEEVGHDPRSSYAEMYWLPVLGPSVTWMLRRFAAYLEDAPHGADVCVQDLARSLGIGERSGPNGPLPRTLKRCVDFEMAEWRESSLAVRRKLPPLARRHLRRLPDTLQTRHFKEVESTPPLTASERLRVHGCRLALSLMDFGEDRAAAEQQLVRWAFHPALASACATWAALQQAKRTAERAAHPAGGRPGFGTTPR